MRSAVWRPRISSHSRRDHCKMGSTIRRLWRSSRHGARCRRVLRTHGRFHPRQAPPRAATASAPIPTAPPASLAISPAASAAASQTGLKATYISTGPIGDNPFLQLIANGLTQAGKDCGVQTSIVESKDTTVMADNFRAAIDEKTDLIVANSFDSVDAITKLGKQFPDQKWAVVDTMPTTPMSAAWSSRSTRART